MPTEPSVNLVIPNVKENLKNFLHHTHELNGYKSIGFPIRMTMGKPTTNNAGMVAFLVYVYFCHYNALLLGLVGGFKKRLKKKKKIVKKIQLSNIT